MLSSCMLVVRCDVLSPASDGYRPKGSTLRKLVSD